MSGRLPSKIEAHGFLRQAEALGGFAHVLCKGDPDSGAVALLIVERGRPVALLERRMATDFSYRWARVDRPGSDERSFRQDRARIDPDSWLIELDIAEPERFIAETTRSG